MKSMTWLVAAMCLSTALPAAGAAARSRQHAVPGDGQERRRRRSRATNGTATIDRSAITTGTATASCRATRSASAPRAPNRWDDRNVEDSIGRDDDWTPAHFRALDHNRDSRLSRAEWHSTGELFARIDRNRDSFISQAEFIST